MNILKPRRALNKAFLKVKPVREDIEKFKGNLIALLDQINETESEEHHKNLVSDFLKNTYFAPEYFINTKGRNDLVIHNGKTAKTSVGVIIEAKKPTNKGEMLDCEDINTKAFQELVLYYLRERVTLNNLEVKHLIATNIYEWFIFDVAVFEKYFTHDKKLVKQFEEFEAGRLADKSTDFFYKSIACPAIEKVKTEIEFTYFDIRDYDKPLRNSSTADDNKLIALFKLMSPQHLLKLPFTNDSNTLDKKFYTELLHIIGLTETKEKNKKVITRLEKKDRNTGSLLENAINEIDALNKLSRIHNVSHYGSDSQERLFNVGLELVITWINRILFLKLLEAQLVNYHKGNKEYSFLNIKRLENYDDVNSLFFQVLARKPEDRTPEVAEAFATVPYLNSSLFEPTELEHTAICISGMRDERKLPIISSTVLKDDNGKKITGELSTLEYLFRFLDAYDFASEGTEDIQEENKSLINASVLGLIFEKINGYKDGSFFTPGFITMYMCRETIRRAVVQKFNEVKGWECKDFDQLYDKIEDRTEANTIINSLKICDPAVGSGHFLVSALNEIISVKNDLRVLQDTEGKRLKEYQVEVANDELVVTDDDGELFEYTHASKESLRVQKTLFHEKQTIIENCLFGVDINPNSVKICRLRLWIELLKNAYYNCENQLETLPNIDINIKCGNSLISRFDLECDLTIALKKSKTTIKQYQNAVQTYREASSKEQKWQMQELIDGIKNNFRTEISNNDPLIAKLYKAKGKLETLQGQGSIFEQSAAEKKEKAKQEKKLLKEIEKIEAEVEEIRSNKIYENAFEWRFEFPEVLDKNGKFIGFDIVIGNPPYIRQESFSADKPMLKKKFDVFSSTADLYVYFIERSHTLLKSDGCFSFICSNKFIKAQYGSNVRKFIANDTKLLQLIDFGELPVFDNASTFPLIIITQNSKEQPKDILLCVIKDLSFDSLECTIRTDGKRLDFSAISDDNWTLADPMEISLLSKIITNSTPLCDYISSDIYYGIKTGLNEAFIIDEATCDRIITDNQQCRKFIKPFAKGDDIRKYFIRNNKRFLVCIPKGYTKSHFPVERQNEKEFFKDFPELYRHLKPYAAKAEHRTDKGDFWWELRACEYYNKFEEAKIIYPVIAKESRFSLDKDFLSNDKSFIIPESDYYLLGILNSSCMWLFLKRTCSVLGDADKGGRLELRAIYLKKAPIPEANNEIKSRIETLVKQILEMKSTNVTSDVIELESEIDQLVYKLYDLTPEEIAIIEGQS